MYLPQGVTGFGHKSPDTLLYKPICCFKVLPGEMGITTHGWRGKNFFLGVIVRWPFCRCRVYMKVLELQHTSLLAWINLVNFSHLPNCQIKVLIKSTCFPVWWIYLYCDGNIPTTVHYFENQQATKHDTCTKLGTFYEYCCVITIVFCKLENHCWRFDWAFCCTCSTRNNSTNSKEHFLLQQKAQSNLQYYKHGYSSKSVLYYI